jgi:hypothetical protein
MEHGGYNVFTRTWWRNNPAYPNGLEPSPGRKRYMARGVWRIYWPERERMNEGNQGSSSEGRVGSVGDGRGSRYRDPCVSTESDQHPSAASGFRGRTGCRARNDLSRKRSAGALGAKETFPSTPVAHAHRRSGQALPSSSRQSH